MFNQISPTHHAPHNRADTHTHPFSSPSSVVSPISPIMVKRKFAEVDVNHADKNGMTALHREAKKGDPDAMQVLIGAGANIKARNKSGRSPLLVAGALGKLNVVKMLVEAGAGVRATDNEGDTCFILAACFGHTEIVRYLAGLPEVELNHKGRNEHTALHCAVKENHKDVVRVLIDAGADIVAKDDGGLSPLHWACTGKVGENGKIAIVKMLVEAGADVRATDSEGDTCFILAARSGHTEIVRYLAGLPKVELNHKGRNEHTAWHSAVDGGHSDVVQVLIDAGADIEVKKKGVFAHEHSPLLWACAKGKIAIVKMLVKAGADVRRIHEGDTCLILAAVNGHTKTVRYLVGLREVELNYRGYWWNTALHWAVRGKYLDVVRVLIDAGADVEVKNEDRLSPLHYASISEEDVNGKITIVKMLVKAGAGVRAADNQGDTCLTIAARTGHTETVRYLVGLPEVELNHKGSRNRTALFWAVRENYPDVVQVLIDAGADVEVKDDGGLEEDGSAYSPLELASLHGRAVCAKMLVEAGAAVAEADKNRDSCLLLSLGSGDVETVRYLAGLPQVDVDEVRNGKSALICEILKVRPSIIVVQTLIDAGAGMDSTDGNGRTPLHSACVKGNIAIVKMLVRAGAEVCVADNARDTCLNIAAAKGHTETVRYLVGLPEVDVNHQGFNNPTVLHSAVCNGHIHMAQVLIDAGADVEATDEKGRLPIHWASSSGALAIVKMLVDAGAGVRARDNEGATCLSLAGDNGHTDTVRYLVNLPEVEVKQTHRLGNTALPEQGTATKEEVKALQEMMKSVMDQQKEMLEAQKGVLGPTQQTAPVSEQQQEGGMAELRAECAEMRKTVRQCSEHIVKLAEEMESMKQAQRKDKGKGPKTVRARRMIRPGRADEVKGKSGVR